MGSTRNTALWLVALVTVLGLTVSACGQAGSADSGQPGAAERQNNPDDADDGAGQDAAAEDQDDADDRDDGADDRDDINEGDDREGVDDRDDRGDDLGDDEGNDDLDDNDYFEEGDDD